MEAGIHRCLAMGSQKRNALAPVGGRGVVWERKPVPSDPNGSTYG